MSPSWRNRLAVALYPDRVVWLRADKGLRLHVTAKGIQSCTYENGAAWSAAVSVLTKVMQDADANGAQVSVLLSNRLMRYAVTPNPDSANSRQELDLMARYAFERAHGEFATGWDIRLSDAAPGRPALAGAVDRELLSSLRETVAGSGARLVSIRPYLMAAFNRSGRKAHGRNGIFVLAEPERLCQLAWNEGGWCAVQQGHALPDWHTNLDATLDRMAMNAGMQDIGTLQLYMPEIDLPPVHGRWNIDTVMPVWPTGLSPLNDRSYAGAMLGLG